jgi:hypothetical protein
MMKDKGVRNGSDNDCSSKWRNMKSRYHQLLSPIKKATASRTPWPFKDKMNLLLKDNPVVKLEHVTEVVSGEMQETAVKPKVKFLVVNLFRFNEYR